MVDAELAQQATSKVPPYWSPDLELRGYPFAVWLKDLGLWAAGTELAAERVAPVVAQRLGGAAKTLVRELPPNLLQTGRFDPVTGQQVQTGLEAFIAGLRRRFGALGIETSVKAIIDIITFRRGGNENVDEALSRFETLRSQAQELGDGFQLPVQVTAFLLPEAMHIPRPAWPLISTPLTASFPAMRLNSRLC